MIAPRLLESIPINSCLKQNSWCVASEHISVFNVAKDQQNLEFQIQINEFPFQHLFKAVSNSSITNNNT